MDSIAVSGLNTAPPPAVRLSSSRKEREAERNRVILDHLPLVRSIALALHRSLPRHVDLEDLVQAGTLGLIGAVSRYHADAKSTFAGYSKHRIRGAMLDSLRQLDETPRTVRVRLKKVQNVTRDLSSSLQREPTEAEIAQGMGKEVAQLRQLLARSPEVIRVSAGGPQGDHGEALQPVLPSPPEQLPDRLCLQEELRATVRDATKALPERYQRLLFLYYVDNLKMREIGTILGVNESRVSQIHHLALKRMCAFFEAKGISSARAF